MRAAASTGGGVSRAGGPSVRLAGLALIALLPGAVLAQPVARGLTGYEISIGDALQIDFLDDREDAFDLTVGTDGAVQLPFIGAFPLAGKPLAEAREVISAAYVDAGILVAPRIEVSVVKLRPVSVVGDVQKPGIYDYNAELTVEVAVGLAGGPLRPPGGEEARATQRIALRSELARIDTALLREGVEAARLNAQLSGASRIDDTRTPPHDAAEAALVASLIDQSDKIIAAEQAQFEAERQLIADALTEIEIQLDLTEGQIEAQKVRARSYDEELVGAEDLNKRGLLTATSLADLRRRVADEETDLLRLRTEQAATRRSRLGLEREALDLNYGRMQAWRESLVESSVRTAQLQAERLGVLDRLAMLQDWTAHMAEAADDIQLTYMIRRTAKGGTLETLDLGATDPVLPGDVVIVRALIEMPRDAERVQ